MWRARIVREGEECEKSFERDSAEAVCIASAYDTPVSQKRNEWSLRNVTEWRSMIALTFGLLINDLTRKLTSSIGQAVRMRKLRFFSMRLFSVQSSVALEPSEISPRCKYPTSSQGCVLIQCIRSVVQSQTIWYNATMISALQERLRCVEVCAGRALW